MARLSEFPVIAFQSEAFSQPLENGALKKKILDAFCLQGEHLIHEIAKHKAMLPDND
jgi:hypothetical protein